MLCDVETFCDDIRKSKLQISKCWKLFNSTQHWESFLNFYKTAQSPHEAVKNVRYCHDMFPIHKQPHGFLNEFSQNMKTTTSRLLYFWIELLFLFSCRKPAIFKPQNMEFVMRNMECGVWNMEYHFGITLSQVDMLW